MDIYERDGELTLVLALPGVSAEHIEVLLDGEHLIVRGERPIPHAVRNSYIHRLEMPYGRFERNIVLPAGTFEAAARQFENGCLTLVFKPRRGA
ncbi:MAG: Hsp20/alpha crystallin family protein [Rhodocyclaceae bacterium]|nr:Hsp20/alpha crystallin family protein [Rhodocyclaceae bacterium]